ncbi:Zn-dependent hydrolase [Fructobacillus evanidus]|uniref:Acetylornithine deacetylase/Succinyl-diaminopimelate desuccinylase or related deacylase (ArgE) n=1 Tax=Fructobacillus evanidus TaxID=3064281 RepID=A0ABM9MTN3_9LACO|nr:Acetylornithine deacetylase/Succinyl-diaminopimelate desuccinylase or related deacylase (ArgE) [Fructobacillus sp. LMG 32999]CAK1234681.1 Acetylornithine deacetylase/Succinyl-diaminopimelate desuccinylase or related deacylase (ArgE) [Fructobacillus sp. LMG 32999]CAK1235731.1 Acetylornithine deacetylase/Succinyl-diaminopimelate desuccinylase or related deacylase (ArgE) [Fructobacillus sp. LMG 32999]CAK1239369.1 Acetylornithine deacetylase/Succinyl-diaminopimelate desuccinylase or related deacy
MQDKKINDLLESFQAIGRTKNQGYTRTVYDQAWCQAQKRCVDIIKELGLVPWVDEIGNLYATADLTWPKEPVILVGSHLDTVVDGGLYDGLYGALSGVLSVSQIVKSGQRVRRPLVAVIFSEEEGSRFDATFTGSQYLLGRNLKDFDDLVDARGQNFGQVRQAAVGALSPFVQTALHLKVAQYLELHIEQGPILENAGTDIGIVTTIVGQERFLIQLAGQANHAGTTPMDCRDDALQRAVSLLADLYRELAQIPDLRYTIGKVQLEPNVANVIPGLVTFSLDLRHQDQCVLSGAVHVVAKLVDQYRAKLERTTAVMPTQMDAGLQEKIAGACQSVGLTYQFLPSGAGHDAQVMGEQVPTAMIFVPSVGGVSHVPKEKTTPADLENGQRVLTTVLAKLVGQYEQKEPFLK